MEGTEGTATNGTTLDSSGTAADGSGGGSGTTGTTADGSGGGSSTAGTGTAEDSAASACPENYAAVCGVDGETYDNACVARHAGVEIRRDGPCVGDCEGSCVVAPVGPNLLPLVMVVLLSIRRRRPRA